MGFSAGLVGNGLRPELVYETVAWVSASYVGECIDFREQAFDLHRRHDCAMWSRSAFPSSARGARRGRPLVSINNITNGVPNLFAFIFQKFIKSRGFRMGGALMHLPHCGE
jgi:hypothetical protein